MKRAPAKISKNGWLAATSISESCVKHIDRAPPTKSSAERLVRATSPKVRADGMEEKKPEKTT
jgi:hypothetical protein